MSFRCTKKECQRRHKKNDEDNRLMLTIRDSNYSIYYMNDDGTLDYYDGDGEGQTHIIKCPLCEMEYEFEYHIGYIGEQHVLPLQYENVSIIRKRN